MRLPGKDLIKKAETAKHKEADSNIGEPKVKW
jgi:hypothetical protein